MLTLLRSALWIAIVAGVTLAWTGLVALLLVLGWFVHALVLGIALMALTYLVVTCRMHLAAVTRRPAPTPVSPDSRPVELGEATCEELRSLAAEPVKD